MDRFLASTSYDLVAAETRQNIIRPDRYSQHEPDIIEVRSTQVMGGERFYGGVGDGVLFSIFITMGW